MGTERRRWNVATSVLVLAALLAVLLAGMFLVALSFGSFGPEDEPHRVRSHPAVRPLST